MCGRACATTMKPGACSRTTVRQSAARRASPQSLTPKPVLLCAAQGSYYVRQGVHDYNETWGLLTDDWAAVRSASLVSELRALQPKTLGRWDLWPDQG